MKQVSVSFLARRQLFVFDVSEPGRPAESYCVPLGKLLDTAELSSWQLREAYESWSALHGGTFQLRRWKRGREGADSAGPGKHVAEGCRRRPRGAR